MPATQLYIWPSVIVAAQSLDRARENVLAARAYCGQMYLAKHNIVAELALEPEIREVFWR